VHLCSIQWLEDNLVNDAAILEEFSHVVLHASVRHAKDAHSQWLLSFLWSLSCCLTSSCLLCFFLSNAR
jgi:hypothetical protein